MILYAYTAVVYSRMSLTGAHDLIQVLYCCWVVGTGEFDMTADRVTSFLYASVNISGIINLVPAIWGSDRPTKRERVYTRVCVCGALGVPCVWWPVGSGPGILPLDSTD